LNLNSHESSTGFYYVPWFFNYTGDSMKLVLSVCCYHVKKWEI